MNPKLKQYGVWVDPGDDSSYWEMHDSLTDAVSGNPDKEVYLFTGKPCGKYVLKTVLVKAKKLRAKKRGRNV